MASELDKRKDLKWRTYNFALRVIDLLGDLPRDYIFEVIGKQLLRSATSIGANIVEAQAGRSKRDFTNFYQIALKSCNESKFWLAIIRDKSPDDKSKKLAVALIQESLELGNMLGASLLTLKGKREC